MFDLQSRYAGADGAIDAHPHQGHEVHDHDRDGGPRGAIPEGHAERRQLVVQRRLDDGAGGRGRPRRQESVNFWLG